MSPPDASAPSCAGIARASATPAGYRSINDSAFIR